MSEHKPAQQPDTTSSLTDKTHAAVDRAAASAHRGTDKTADAAEHAAEHISAAGERGREALNSAKEHASDWMDSARNYVRDKPTQSVAMAVAAGWLLGHLLRKR